MPGTGADPSAETNDSAFTGPVVRVAIGELRGGYSPRLNGVDHDHVRALAGTDAKLPPILVHRETMSVIDGMHRLNVAQWHGQETIDVRFFHGSCQEAFRLAVKTNVAHGLPLTLTDRQAATAKIIRSHPALSDRSIAANTGLAAKTVAAIRSRMAEATAPARVGRDGRVRPLSTAEGRRIASQAIAARPEASLREIAREAGISVGTVRDVRARVQAGEDPVPLRQRDLKKVRPTGAARPGSRAHQATEAADIDLLMESLRCDPSLRYTDSGRTLLRWLATRTVTVPEWREAIGGVPPHCSILVAKVARECARAWQELADELNRASTECA